MDVVLIMFLLKNSFKRFLLKKFPLIMTIRVNILYNNGSTFNSYTKNNPILYEAKKLYLNLTKSTTVFNKTTKKLKKKENSRIFTNTTLKNNQSIFNLNSTLNENPTRSYFLPNLTKIIKGGGGKSLMVLITLKLKRI